MNWPTVALVAVILLVCLAWHALNVKREIERIRALGAIGKEAEAVKRARDAA